MQKKINLKRLADIFIRLVTEYMSRHKMDQGEMAKFVGMQRAHLNRMLNKAPDRPLSAYYLFKFVRKGVIKVNQIDDRVRESEREQEFWDMAKEAENMALLSKIARIRKLGVDMTEVLEQMYPGV